MNTPKLTAAISEVLDSAKEAKMECYCGTPTANFLRCVPCYRRDCVSANNAEKLALALKETLAALEEIENATLGAGSKADYALSLAKIIEFRRGCAERFFDE